MKVKVVVFVMAVSLAAFAQGRGRGTGGGMGQGAGMGQGQGVGRGQAAGMGQMDQQRDQTRDRQRIHQQQLSQVQLNSGAFKMLQNKTGNSADQLKQMYANSGARNFGDFASALIVSKNLNLDTGKVLEGIKTQPLGQVLRNMNVERNRVRAEIQKAHQEVLEADKKPKAGA